MNLAETTTQDQTPWLSVEANRFQPQPVQIVIMKMIMKIYKSCMKVENRFQNQRNSVLKVRIIQKRLMKTISKMIKTMTIRSTKIVIQNVISIYHKNHLKLMVHQLTHKIPVITTIMTHNIFRKNKRILLRINFQCSERSKPKCKTRARLFKSWS